MQITINRIGLGAMPLSIAGRPAEERSIAVIHRALDLGVTFLDTADAYCLDETDKHHNERLIAKALRTYQGDVSRVIVATKGGLIRPGGDWVVDGNPARLRKAIQRSYEALGGEKPIDLWQWHAPDPHYALEESLQPVKEAQAKGVIRHIGLSNVSVEEIERVREMVEIVSIQNQYNPWNRSVEQNGVLDYCEREQLTFLPWGPLGGSRRVKTLARDFPQLAALARDKAITPHRLVLAWMLHKSPCIVLIPGATRVESIEDSIAALDVKVTDVESIAVEKAFAA